MCAPSLRTPRISDAAIVLGWKLSALPAAGVAAAAAGLTGGLLLLLSAVTGSRTFDEMR